MGGREHEYNREQQSQDAENKRQSGELAKGEEQKLPFRGAPKKSLFLEALVQMNMQGAENKLLREQLDKQQETGKDKKQPAKETRATPKYDLDEPPKSQIDKPPRLPENYVPELSPLLEQISEGVLVPLHVIAAILEHEEDKELAQYIAQRAYEVKVRHFLELKNRVLLEENQRLRAENKELHSEIEVYKEKEDLQRQRVSKAVARRRKELIEQDPEGYRAKEQQRLREYRARKKREAKDQQLSRGEE